MSVQDLAVARVFFDALASAAKTGDRDGLYPLLSSDVEWLTYRMKETGDFAYARDRQIELTVRGAKIARYELRFTG
jgi:ketosteroid isomerase-like protein